MANIRLEVVTPDRTVVSEEVQTVTVPGSIGEFGVLAGHTPFLTTLKMGIIRYNDVDGVERCVFISEGFAEALPDKVTVLAESAERRRDIDIDRARVAIARAKKRLAAKEAVDVDFTRAEAALQRASHRLKLGATKRKS